MAGQVSSRAEKLQKAQAAERRDATVRKIVLGLGGLVILALIGAIVFAVVMGSRDDKASSAGSGSTAAPANLANGAIPFGKATAPVTVQVYFDYMCPACGAFEANNGPELKRLMESGTAKVELRPLAFLDRYSNGTEYSSRAANALATVADGAPDKVLAFHEALYANQPAENTEGLSDTQIADLAKGAGVPDAVVARFAAGEFRVWVTNTTQEALTAGIDSTPTVLVNGQKIADVFTAGPLTQAIESAAGKG